MSLRFRFALACGICLAVSMQGEHPGRSHAAGADAQTSTRGAEGATSTLLADGRVLVLGGSGGTRPLTTAAIHDPRTGRTEPLPASLNRARTGHTATVLPDGRVAIVGGIGVDGRVEDVGELFDPATGSFTSVHFPGTPRARHTATLLPDGRVLLAGGTGGEHGAEASAELWNPLTGRVTQVAGGLGTARSVHTATLEPDGTVRVSGGAPGAVDDELYLPGPDVFVSAMPAPQPLAFPYLARSIPEDRARNVAPDAVIALHFSRPVAPASISGASITLSSAGATHQTSVVVAEQGFLVFVRPGRLLAAGEVHTLEVRGLRDATGTGIPFASVSFTVAGDRATPAPAGDEEAWIPGLNSDPWKTGRPQSPWQQLPPLRAADGVTALAGQVLRLNGTPLADVTLEIEGHAVRSDGSGRFLLLLDSLESGHYKLEIQGATASRAGKTYGFFEAGIRITATETTVLPFTIWMPLIDTAHAVTIPSPTTAEDTVITTPRIPGLELHLPRGTVIRDEDGQRVREVSITPVPVDRPPFPLPANVEVPIYFTIQPGGAYVATYGQSKAGARLIYPNYTNQPAGTLMDFWHYTPGERGWYVYGRGSVDGSARQVVPDPGVAIYEFTGAMISSGWTPPSWWPPFWDWLRGADPVDLSTGLFVYEKTDVFLSDVIPIALTRTYRQGDSISRSFGIGTEHPYNLNLWRPTGANYDEAALVLPDGARVPYVRTSPDPGTTYVGLVLEHQSSGSPFYKSTIIWNGNGWDLTMKNGTVLVFGDNLPLQEIRDRHGNSLKVLHTAGQSGLITRVVSPNNRWVSFSYDGAFRVSSATDNLGRTVSYTYDGSGRLWKVTDFAGGVTEHTYDASHRMLTIKDPRGITYLTNVYDSNGRVSTQTLADTGEFEFAYTLDGSNRVTQTDMTDPLGRVQRTKFNSAGHYTEITEALGTGKERTTCFTRANGTHVITSMHDELGRRTDYTYDANANVTSITRLAGTGDAVTTEFTYDPAYQQLASVTDPLDHTTTFSYDYQGRLTSVSDPLSHQTTFTYNPAGQPLTVTNALTQTTTFAYDLGNLVSITNPLSEVETRVYDGAGRLLRVTDRSGRVTRHEYNALDQVTKTIDALGGETTFTYDGNGNLLTLTDARGKTTTWTYDSMDRMATREDPLTREESFTYDLNGNLKTWTDRKGQVTSYGYDELNRRTFVGFGTTGIPPTYASTITTTYDAGDRATQVVDSVAGTISRTYDLLNRLEEEDTPEGTVNYTYDDADRRASMTVAGQTAVSYTYDNADRLTAITQGTATVSLAYDTADRRTSLTLPNGIVMEYAYDDASHLAGLTYKLSGATIGALAYVYDPSGQRVAVEGTYARSNLPAALASATYDNANQIATFGGTTFSYDSNGNLTSDGSRTYSWNSRNELTGITGAVTASFSYDGVGRRRAKTVGSVTTQFLYDGLNPVQELAGGTPNANVLTGLRIDEYLRRTDATTTRYYMPDALGSPVGLSDGAGTIQTEYTYEPFGGSSTSGASTTNTIGFTGREADGTGVLFYRARYYDPRLQRFIAEDPVGLDAGDVNLHAYVSNDPANVTDPTGEFGIGGCAIGAALALAPHLPTLLAGRGSIPILELAIGCALGGFGSPALGRLPRLRRAPSAPPGTYRPPQRLPRGPHGEFAPSSPYPHTQLGTGRGGGYTSAREFGPNGRPIRDIHFTDHGSPKVPGHVNPHQHPWIPNPTGGTPQFGPPTPYIW